MQGERVWGTVYSSPPSALLASWVFSGKRVGERRGRFVGAAKRWAPREARRGER